VTPKRVLTIAGTRPEAVKLAPLVRRLDLHGGIVHRFVATGQHGAPFHGALADFGIEADEDLRLPNLSPDSFAAELRRAIPSLLEAFAPDLVLVQGDTTSAWATARAAAAAGVAVGHVEAGLRSGNPVLPWPEERNRIEIDALSALLFAPCESAADNLVGLPGEIHVTGNTGIDALLEMRARTPLTLHDSNAAKIILVTCHRGESIPRLDDLARALRSLARRDDVDIVVPVHGNPAVGGPLRKLLAGVDRVRLIDPLSYPEMLRMMQAAYLLLTDSGGLQEEAPALGLPALILRDVTERPEPLSTGNARLVGLAPSAIVREAERLLDDAAVHARMSRPAFPYGRGDAAARTVEAIARWFGLGLPQMTHDQHVATNYG
jgi:UDP-N-acetylglucosamine 2-epimerase (non-hydrolysing)